MVGWLIIGLCSGAVRVAEGREGGQKEGEKIPLAAPHLHKELDRNKKSVWSTVHLVTHNTAAANFTAQSS